MNESRVINVVEAAKMLGVSYSLAYKLIRENRFPARTVRVGRRVVVVRDSLERLLADREEAAR